MLASRCCLCTAVAGCKQEGTITVHSITFKGVHGVDESRLRSALATRENAKVPVVGWELPWGRKNYFDRGRFDTDLKRIAAFYADRGYPDARVTGVEPKLNAKQDSIDVTVTIDEGDPVVVTGVDFVGFDVLPRAPPSEPEEVCPAQSRTASRPPGRARTTHEMAVNELRDSWLSVRAGCDGRERSGAPGRSDRRLQGRPGDACPLRTG